MSVKLHIGSGSVYLTGWRNIDVQTHNTFLANDRPDLVQRWRTTDDDYYARHQDKTQDALRAGPLDQEYVCDVFGSFANIPAAYFEADEVLARHSFEHLSITEAHRALDSIDAIMNPNGILRLDVPDHEATLKLFQETGDDFYIRHLLGPRRNEFGYHMMSYTRDRLRALVEDHGFIFVHEEPNIHFYPAFCLRFVKPGPRAAVEYAIPPYDIPTGWKVLEIGPGTNPFLRADVYVDRTMEHLQPMQDRGKSTILADLMDGLPGIADKQFDYVWCSHVLEHTDDPFVAALTLSRVARRGTVVLPSVVKESIFNFEETDHKWMVLPGASHFDPPIFVRQNAKHIGAIRNSDVQKISSRLYRTGPNRDAESRHLRRWFYNNEPNLDVIVHWEGEFNLRVVD